MALGMECRAEWMIGETVDMFGVKAVVVDVVPATDWMWQVTLSSLNGGGAAEKWTVDVPTDYRTTDGAYCYADEEN